MASAPPPLSHIPGPTLPLGVQVLGRSMEAQNIFLIGGGALTSTMLSPTCQLSGLPGHPKQRIHSEVHRDVVTIECVPLYAPISVSAKWGTAS